MMNTESPSNGASEIKRLFTKNYKTLSTPPHFYLKYVGIAHYGRRTTPVLFPSL